MKAIVSGLVNIETNVAVKGFPLEYFPIDYPFFGVESSVGGVGYNISKALTVLGDEVCFYSLIGNDLNAKTIECQLKEDNIGNKEILKTLKSTPQSVVLYDKTGKREIYCDLKDIQENSYEPVDDSKLDTADVCILCNINFNRKLLSRAKDKKKLIATDVHVLSDVNDSYNKDFIENADILFMSDEGVLGHENEFLKELASSCKADVIVMGRGKKGLTYFDRKNGLIKDLPAYETKNVVNTVGAGDALFSAFLHFYILGEDLERSLIKAQIFAGKKIESNGAAKGFINEGTINEIYNRMNYSF